MYATICFRHVVFAPSVSKSYASSAFPGIGDSLFTAKSASMAEQDAAWWRVQVCRYPWLNRLLLARSQSQSVFEREDNGSSVFPDYIASLQQIFKKDPRPKLGALTSADSGSSFPLF